MRLRSMLNREEQPTLLEGPTKYKKGANQWELICSFCGGTYYVDEVTFAQAMSAMEKDIENPFCCDDCEAAYEDLAH